MLLAIVDGGLIALERGFVNPFQTFLFIDGNTVARHVKPANGKLCLGIAAVGCQLIPESTLRQVFLYTITVPIGRSAVLLTLYMSLESSLAISEEGFMVILLYTVAQIIGIGHIDL